MFGFISPLNKILTYLLLFIALVSCRTPIELKTINWNENQISWTVLDGGATTSFYWKIFFSKKGSDSQNLIFESYSSPYITDISIKDNNLIIHCLVEMSSTDIISIDLNQIEDFIDNPIKYNRTLIEQTNEAYNEPEFVKMDRKFAIEHKLTN